MPRKIQRYGWRPELPDHRDRHYAPRMRVAPIPDKVDLRDNCPGVYDQGELGSCTANAIAAAVAYDARTQQSADITPSRLFIYYGERDMEGNAAIDSGAFIRDGIKFVNTTGVCGEDEWPYDIANFATRPPQDCWDNATEVALVYERLDNTDLGALLGCLADGLPFVFGFTVYDGFESEAVAQTGKLDLPTTSESVVGGHAVLAVGYDRATRRISVRNSWGDSWGQKGYFTMPWEYATNPDLADDFWVIRRTGNVQHSNNPPLPNA